MKQLLKKILILYILFGTFLSTKIKTQNKIKSTKNELTQINNSKEEGDNKKEESTNLTVLQPEEGVTGYQDKNYQGAQRIYKVGVYEYIKYEDQYRMQCEKFCNDRGKLQIQVPTIQSFKVPPGWTVTIITKFRESDFAGIFDKDAIEKAKEEVQKDEITRYRSNIPCVESYINKKAISISIIIDQIDAEKMHTIAKEALRLFLQLQMLKIENYICLNESKKGLTVKEAFKIRNSLEKEFERRESLELKKQNTQKEKSSEPDQNKLFNNIELDLNNKEVSNEMLNNDSSKKKLTSEEFQTFLIENIKANLIDEKNFEVPEICKALIKQIKKAKKATSKIKDDYNELLSKKVGSKIYSSLDEFEIPFQYNTEKFNYGNAFETEDLKSVFILIKDMLIEYKKEQIELIKKKLKDESYKKEFEAEFTKILNKEVKKQLEKIRFTRDIPEDFIYNFIRADTRHNIVKDILEEVKDDHCHNF